VTFPITGFPAWADPPNEKTPEKAFHSPFLGDLHWATLPARRGNLVTPRSLLFIGSIATAASLVAIPASAETQLRYSITTGGGIAATGNAIGLSKQLDANGPGTEDSIGTFMTLMAGETDNFPANIANPWGAGTTNDWTLNGSEAELVLPNDVEILYAELVWGGSWSYGTRNVQANLNDPILLSTNGFSTTVSPDPVTSLTIQDVAQEGFAINYYLRSADVTDFVEEHGADIYAAEGIPATQDSLIDELNAAGWSLIVVYRNSAEPVRNLTVFVGGEFVDENTSVDYEVDGFCTPPSGAFGGYATFSALEGDADRGGDFLTIAQDAGGPFTSLMGPNNPEDNFFCSQINDTTGNLDTSGTFGNDNHNPVAEINVIGGRQGWDVTTVPVSSDDGHLEAGQTTALLRTQTLDDSYLPTAAGFAIEVNAPDFTGAESGIAPQLVGLDQTATANISFQNVGLVDATNLTFFSPLPAGLTLESFSINGNDGDINGDAVDTGDLETGIQLGDVAVGVSMDIQFTVLVDGPPENGTSWQLFPQWNYDYISCVGEPPLSEPFSTLPLDLDYDEAEGGATSGGQEGDDGLDDTAGEDDDADAGAEDDEADAGAEDDGTTGDGGGDGTGIASASGGMSVGDDSGCGCRSTRPAPGWMLGLLALVGLARRRRPV